MGNTNELYFYWPKIKNALLSLFMLAFMAFGGLVGWVAFEDEVYYMSALGAALALLFIILAFSGLKKVFSFRPYLILAESELIIHTLSTSSVPLRWEDIEAYKIRHVGLNKLIEIKLRNEEDYRRRLSKTANLINTINMTNDRTFVIALGQVKRKDRNKLVRELDRRAFESDNLLHELYNPEDTPEMGLISFRQDRIQEQMDANKKEQQAESQVNGSYLLKLYGISLLLTIGAFFMLHVTDDDESAFILVIPLVFYPYAKVIWDILVGFKLKHKMDKDESSVSMFFYRFMFFVDMVIYFFSIVLAPIGIVYVIVVSVRRKKSEKANSDHALDKVDATGSYYGLHVETKEKKVVDGVHVPFAIRFTVFPLHIILMLAIVYLLIAIEMMSIVGIVALIWFGLTFSIYVALYPEKRNYFLSLIAFLWRIAICFVIEFTLITWTVNNAYLGDVGLMIYTLPLFLPPSYIFYLWGKGGLGQLVSRISN